MKGKWIAGMMICMLFCGVMFWQAGGLSYADQTAVVATEKGDPLNMRAGVGTGTAVLTVIPNGSQVTVLDTAAGSDANGTWYKITYNGQEGYVAAKYISFTAVPSSSPSAATTAPTSVPTPAPQPEKVTVYRTQTTYKKISVPAKLKRTRTICKSTSGKSLKVNKKNVVLNKNKSVKIIAEKTKGSTKWFKISFKYKKKTRKGYIKSTDLKPVLKKAAGGIVTGVKTALRVRKKPGNSNPYYKVKIGRAHV